MERRARAELKEKHNIDSTWDIDRPDPKNYGYAIEIQREYRPGQYFIRGSWKHADDMEVGKETAFCRPNDFKSCTCSVAGTFYGKRTKSLKITLIIP